MTLARSQASSFRQRPNAFSQPPEASRKPAWDSNAELVWRDPAQDSIALPTHLYLHKSCVGWIVNDDTVQAVRVAPWVLEEQRNLQFSQVGFLKPCSGGESRVES